MALVFNKTPKLPEGGNFLKGSNFYLLVGTITVTGAYAAGGDTFAAGKSPEDIAKQIGAGRILAVLSDMRGNNPEWNDATKKLQFYTGAGVELAAAAYPAAMSATPVPVVILAR
jgi:hypothetical protein